MSDANPTGEPLEDSEAIRNMREKIARQDAELATLRANSKTTAFFKAGVKPFEGENADPVAKFFFDNYDGEHTPEAVAEAAKVLGLVTTVDPTPPPSTTATPEEIEQHRQRATLGQNNLPPEVAPKERTMKDAWQESSDILQRGGDQLESSNPVFSEFFHQAANGNPDYQFDAEKWAADARRSGTMDDLLYTSPGGE